MTEKKRLYHITDDGNILPCKAKNIEDCPFNNRGHYEMLPDAQEAYLREAELKYNEKWNEQRKKEAQEKQYSDYMQPDYLEDNMIASKVNSVFRTHPDKRLDLAYNTEAFFKEEAGLEGARNYSLPIDKDDEEKKEYIDEVYNYNNRLIREQFIRKSGKGFLEEKRLVKLLENANNRGYNQAFKDIEELSEAKKKIELEINQNGWRDDEMINRSAEQFKTVLLSSDEGKLFRNKIENALKEYESFSQSEKLNSRFRLTLIKPNGGFKSRRAFDKHIYEVQVIAPSIKNIKDPTTRPDNDPDSIVTLAFDTHYSSPEKHLEEQLNKALEGTVRGYDRGDWEFRQIQDYLLETPEHQYSMARDYDSPEQKRINEELDSRRVWGTDSNATSWQNDSLYD